MGKKKKRVTVNAVDKYIKQIKYRSDLKKPEKTKVRQPKVVIARIRTRRLQDFIDSSGPVKNENKPFNQKPPTAKISRKRKANVSALDESPSAEAVHNSDLNDLSRKKKHKTVISENLASCSNRAQETSNNLRKIRKKKVQKTVLLSDIETVESETAEKLKRSSRASNYFKESNVNARCRSVKAGFIRRNQSTKEPNSKTKNYVSSTNLQNNEKMLLAATESISEDQNIQTENQEDISLIEESSQPDFVSNEPCLCEPSNFHVDDFSEQNGITTKSLIPKKYRSSVEELKSLTPESITKFVNDNQQYYVDFKNAERVRKVTLYGKKKNDEFKDSFKCNPFNSAQQMAMYMALREIFQAPARSFLEYRYFFTLLMPEICCQLFAQVFKIKSSCAPRLIKKLYSKPVCPV